MNQALRRMAVVLVCLGLLLPGVQAGASPAPLVITAKDFGKTLPVTVGQRLTVDLRLTGDDAVAAPEFDPFILTLLGQTLQSSSGPQGSSVRVKYEFEVRKAGQTDLIIPVKAAGERASRAKPLLKIHLVVAPGTGI
jgi:hypothetical protein